MKIAVGITLEIVFLPAVTEMGVLLSYHLPTCLLPSNYHEGTTVLSHSHFNLEKAD